MTCLHCSSQKSSTLTVIPLKILKQLLTLCKAWLISDLSISICMRKSKWTTCLEICRVWSSLTVWRLKETHFSTRMRNRARLILVKAHNSSMKERITLWMWLWKRLKKSQKLHKTSICSNKITQGKTQVQVLNHYNRIVSLIRAIRAHFSIF